MQKLKFILEFIFAIIVECLHSNLLAKLLLHNCARAKHGKTCKCSIQKILQVLYMSEFSKPKKKSTDTNHQVSFCFFKFTIY